jgi:general secretion pathway protein I
LFRKARSKRRRGDAGFTLIEVLVALAVVAVALAAIGSLIAATVRGTRSIDSRLALVETARTVMTGLPDRSQLAPGSFNGQLAGHRWRVEVLPFAADFLDPSSQWLPQSIIVTVQAPTGQMLTLNTVRLRRQERPPQDPRTAERQRTGSSQ